MKHAWSCETDGRVVKCIAFDLDGMRVELNDERYEEKYDRIYWPNDPATIEILKLTAERDAWRRVADLHRLAALDPPTDSTNRIKPTFETQYEMGQPSAPPPAAEYDRIASASANNLLFGSAPLPPATEQPIGLLDESPNETPPGELPSEDVTGRR